MDSTPRQNDLRTVELLKPVAQHRPVVFLQQVLSDFKHIVFPNANKLSIKCGMVQLAQGQPIGHDGLATRFPIRDDVRRIQQFLVPKPTERALLLVGLKHAFPESLLMKPLAEGPGYIRPPYLLFPRSCRTLRDLAGKLFAE